MPSQRTDSPFAVLADRLDVARVQAELGTGLPHARRARGVASAVLRTLASSSVKTSIWSCFSAARASFSRKGCRNRLGVFGFAANAGCVRVLPVEQCTSEAVDDLAELPDGTVASMPVVSATMRPVVLRRVHLAELLAAGSDGGSGPGCSPAPRFEGAPVRPEVANQLVALPALGRELLECSGARIIEEGELARSEVPR